MAGAFLICAKALDAAARRLSAHAAPGSRHSCRVGKRRQLRCTGRRSAQPAATMRVVTSKRLRPALRTVVRRKSPRHCAAHQGADTTIARPALDAETCLSARGARCHRRNAATALRRCSRVFWDVPGVAARVPAHCFPRRCFHCRGSRHVQPCASVFDQGRYGAERSTRRWSTWRGVAGPTQRAVAPAN